MYGMIFEDVFNSTLMQHGGDTAYTFISMVVLSDKDGYFRITPTALADRIKKDISIVRAAITHLEAPDPDSNSKDFDGRRIVPLSELTDGVENRGWFVVNKDYYRKMASRFMRAEATTDRVRAHRERKKSKENNSVTGCNALEQKVTPLYVYVSVFDDLLKNKEWLDRDAWRDFEEHRKAIRKPLTKKSAEKNLAVLEQYPKQQRDIVDTTIRNEWRGLFAPKGKAAAQAQPTTPMYREHKAEPPPKDWRKKGQAGAMRLKDALRGKGQ